MKKLRSGFIIVVLFAVFSFSTLSAQAELFNRGTDTLGNRLIYDSNLNITWYDYTKSPDWWQDQVNWANALTVNFGGTIYDDWRLPIQVNGGTRLDMTPDTFGYRATNEMGYLYYIELGNIGQCDASGNNCNQQGYGLLNKGPFINLQPDEYYAGVTKATYPVDAAWVFVFSSGAWATIDINDRGYGGDGAATIAVRPGDVAVVPEPISFVLFVTGGTILVGRRYIKKNNRL